MDVREKLVELIDDIQVRGEDFTDYEIYGMRVPDTVSNEDVASHLIAHGVTVHEWISVKDRLPTIYDADEDNCVLAIHKASKKRYYHWRSVADNPFDFTHWMKTPQPPKGE